MYLILILRILVPLPPCSFTLTNWPLLLPPSLHSTFIFFFLLWPPGLNESCSQGRGVEISTGAWVNHQWLNHFLSSSSSPWLSWAPSSGSGPWEPLPHLWLTLGGSVSCLPSAAATALWIRECRDHSSSPGLCFMVPSLVPGWHILSACFSTVLTEPWRGWYGHPDQG